MAEIDAALAETLREGDVVLLHTEVHPFPAFSRVELKVCPICQDLGLVPADLLLVCSPLWSLKDSSGGLPTLTLVRKASTVYRHGDPQ